MSTQASEHSMEPVSAEHEQEQQRHLEAALAAVEVLGRHLGALDTLKARAEVKTALHWMTLHNLGVMMSLDRSGRLRDAPPRQ